MAKEKAEPAVPRTLRQWQTALNNARWRARGYRAERDQAILEGDVAREEVDIIRASLQRVAENLADHTRTLPDRHEEALRSIESLLRRKRVGKKI